MIQHNIFEYVIVATPCAGIAWHSFAGSLAVDETAIQTEQLGAAMRTCQRARLHPDSTLCQGTSTTCSTGARGTRQAFRYALRLHIVVAFLYGQKCTFTDNHQTCPVTSASEF